MWFKSIYYEEGFFFNILLMKTKSSTFLKSIIIILTLISLTSNTILLFNIQVVLQILAPHLWAHDNIGKIGVRSERNVGIDKHWFCLPNITRAGAAMFLRWKLFTQEVSLSHLQSLVGRLTKARCQGSLLSWQGIENEANCLN